MTPMITRKTPSPFPTFFALIACFSSLNSGAPDKKPHSFSEMGSKFNPYPYPPHGLEVMLFG